MSNYVIKNIDFDDIGEAFKLVKNVFMEFDAPDYSQEGVNEFIENIIKNLEFINKFKICEQIMIGAFDDDKIKLNSSPYARSFYNKIGFVDTDIEQVKNGIRYTPMELNIND